MKKTLQAALAVLLFTLVTSTAYAWWRADARVEVNPARVTGAVYNGLNRPIVCRGRVIGMLRSGHTLWSDAGGVVYPGRYAYVYVYTNDPYNPFVNGRADVQCRTR